MPATLPPSPPLHLQHSGHMLSAYNILLRLENSITTKVSSASTDKEKNELERSLVFCRIVGWFFHHVPSDRGLKNLEQEVSSCEMDATKLLALGKVYYDHGFRVFRAAKGRTPIQSHHPSRPSFNNLAELIKSKLVEAPLSHKTAKEKALVRDGFKCMVTGVYDVNSVGEVQELQAIAGTNFAAIQCAHIISESTNVGIGEGGKKADFAAGAWAVLSRFGREDILDELNGSDVHRLENVLTLEVTVHQLFDKLELYLEPTNIPNEYQVNVHNPAYRAKYSGIVTFTSSRPGELPLPSRDYLALHAACAKVAHLSGAAEYIDRMDRDIDEIFVLAENGGSASVLDHAISAALRCEATPA